MIIRNDYSGKPCANRRKRTSEFGWGQITCRVRGSYIGVAAVATTVGGYDVSPEEGWEQSDAAGSGFTVLLIGVFAPRMDTLRGIRCTPS
jgi:hypothetical protein